MDEIAEKNDEEVVMQIGATDYKPKHAKYFDFVDEDEKLFDFLKRAKVVVAHAGAGTILTALRFNKPLIVVPRLKKFGEHVDDQQRELADALSNEGKVIAIYEIEKLEEALRAIDTSSFTAIETNNKLANFLKDYLG